MIHNWKYSKKNSLPFYLSMPPLEFHHPKSLKALFLLIKQQYLQHLLRTVKATQHAISYFLHTLWLSCSFFLTHHFLVVFLEMFSLYESYGMNKKSQTPCCSIRLQDLIKDTSTYFLSHSQPKISISYKYKKTSDFFSNEINPNFSSWIC